MQLPKKLYKKKHKEEYAKEIEDIIKEKTSADHLLYVSLKYTKTCDVILNLLARWKSLIELSFDSILEKGVEKGKIPNMPQSPKERIEFLRKYFKKSEEIKDQRGIASSLRGLGMISAVQHHFDKHINYINRAKIIYEEIGDERGIYLTLHDIGNYYREKGDYDKAFSHLQKAVNLQKEI
mgnify:CR=1 FL=1